MKRIFTVVMATMISLMSISAEFHTLPDNFFNGETSAEDDENFVLRILETQGFTNPRNLLNELKNKHPTTNGPIYHSFHHTILVAKTIYALAVDDEESSSEHEDIGHINDNEIKLLLVAALLHDLDPRNEVIPPKVEETVKFLNEEEGSRFFEFFFPNVEKKEVIALIRHTDYSPVQEELTNLMDIAENETFEIFGEDKFWRANQLGKLLAFADKISMYLKSKSFAREAVRGLASEIGFNSDDNILMKTPDFLNALKNNQNYNELPEAFKNIFLDINDYFKRIRNNLLNN